MKHFFGEHIKLDAHRGRKQGGKGWDGWYERGNRLEPSGTYFINNGDKLAKIDRLDPITINATGVGFGSIIRCIGGCQYHHGDRPKVRIVLDDGENFESADMRHTQIKENQIGSGRDG